MTIAFGCIIGYIILTNILGLVVGRRVKTSPEFLVANGNFGPIFLVAILCGAWEGSGASMGISQQAYSLGIYPGFYTAFFALGLVVAGYFVVPLARKLKIVTLPELIGMLFGQNGRKATAVLWLAQDLIVGAAQFLGAAGIFSALFGIPIPYGILITVASVALYMIMGGMVAAAWTNILHTVVMFTAAIITVPLVMNYGGGFQGAIETLPPKFFNVSGMGMETLLGWFLAVSSGPIIHQITFSTAASAKSTEEARKSFFISAAVIALFAIPFAMVGVMAKAYLPPTTSLMALPLLAVSINPWFGGLLLSAVMAAIVSTLAPMLFSTPTVFVNDIYMPLRKNTTEKERLLVSRLAAAGTLLISMGLALTFTQIVTMTVFAFTFRLVILFCVAIPILVASWKFVTVEGGLLGIIFGAIAPTVSQFVLQSKIPGMYLAIAGCLIGIIVGSVLFRSRGNYIKTIWVYMKERALDTHKDSILDSIQETK